MKKILSLTLVIFGVAFASANARADSAREAESFVAGLIDGAIEALKIDPSDQAARRGAFRTLLESKFDVEGIRQRVLGRAWRDATPEQKERFAEVFDEHILNVYVGQLGPYNNEIVRLRRTERLSEEELIVFSEVVRSQGNPLRLDWRVHRTGTGGLGVLDVAADGASLLRAKRDEFRTVVQRQGIDGLIERLADMNARFRSADS